MLGKRSIEKNNISESNSENRSLNKQQIDEKEENLDKIIKMLLRKAAAGGGDTITNNEVEDFLKVSDSTAEEYLDTLEHRGLLEQVGEEGRGVFYKLK